MTELNYVLYPCICLILFLSIRTVYLIHKVRTNHKPPNKKFNRVKSMICIGSGGHTSEMMKLIKHLNLSFYTPRCYVMAQTDSVSEQKIVDFEGKREFEIIKLPRSRQVNQSYVSSVFTTVYSFMCCVPVLLRVRPDLVLCNGPGFCVPICLGAFLLKMFFVCEPQIVFVESVCRVKSFSLTGKILSYFADEIVVHWSDLKEKEKRAVYLGNLI